MKRIFILAYFLLQSTAVLGQVPPGSPYRAGSHPNAILTYVAASDFKSSEYSDAQDTADFELFGLSQSEGRRQSIEIAVPASRTQKVKVLGRDIEVLFYPVVRQTFALTEGGEFVLHSFKFPRVSIPAEIVESVLNEAAFEKTKKPEDARFGMAAPPERLDIRGNEALLFDDDGVRTVFWVEDGVVHTGTAAVPQSDLLRVVDDLL